MGSDEQINKGRSMVMAALSKLGPRIDVGSEVDQNDICRLVLNAMSAAQKVYDESKCDEDMVQPQEAVASAFAMWESGVDLERNEIAPFSLSGMVILGFAQAIAASWMQSEAKALANDGDMLMFCGRAAEDVLLVMDGRA